MNYLAHLFLSGDDQELKIGNFIADSVKGKPSQDLFSAGVIKGIEVHRKIDTYTDSNPIVLESIKRLRDRHGKFSGIVVDIAYDHFLAKNWNNYSSVELYEYVHDSYALMMSHRTELPEKVQRFLPYMVKSNWLYHYKTLDGIDKVYKGMSKRIPAQNNMASAMKDIWMDYELYEAEFSSYFPTLISYVQSLLLPVNSSSESRS
jgi:acyl carrier protein phosphodiesterase